MSGNLSSLARVCGVLCASLLCINAAAAESDVVDKAAEDPDPPPVALDQIQVIGSKVPRTIGEVPGTVTVIESEQMERELVRNIRDLVRYEPGLSVNNDAERFGLGGFNIRGIDANRVAVELDGMPISDTFSVGDFASSGRDYVDPEILKRVEILRGPASSLYGSDALGGVVTYTTKDPDDYLSLIPGPFYLGVKGGWSGEDDGQLLTGITALDMGDWQSLFVWSKRKSDELDNAATDANPQDNDARSYLAKLVHDAGAGGRLRLTAGRTDADSKTDVQSLVNGPGRYASTTAMFGDDDQRRLRLSSEYEFDGPGGWLEGGVVRLYRQESEIDQRTIQDRDPSSREPFRTRRQREFHYEQDVVGGEITLESAFYGAGYEHRLVYGMEAHLTDTKEYRKALQTNLEDGSSSNVVLGETFPVRDFPKSETIEAGVYLQDEIRADGSRLTWIPALRWDYYDLDPDEDAMWREDHPGASAVGMNQSELSPKLGLVYKANDRWSAYGQYSRGFRAPPFDDANLALFIPQFGFMAIPNPDLDSETSNGFEVGLRHGSQAVSASLAVFYTRYEDLIESRVNLGVDPDSGLLLFQSQNREKATIYGSEFRSQVDLGAMRSSLDGFSLRASLAWTRGEDESRNEPLNSIDPAKAVVGVGYESPTGRWGAELIGSFVDKKRRVDDSLVNLYETDGYGIVDLIGRVSLSPKAELVVGLFNLTDKTYWEWSDVRGLPTDDPNIDLYARPGINGSVSFKYSFGGRGN
jgi:hemoglobin/transferrin/lactoferrin receptor protein